MVYDSGFRGLGFRIDLEVLRVGIQGLGFRTSGLGLRIDKGPQRLEEV